MSFFDKLAEWLDLDDFDKRDKVAFVSLACVAVVIVVLWVMQLQNNIVGPLYGGLSPAKIKQAALNEQAQVASADAELKNKDTDTDGLSDWDEMNLYKSSPYLADSDSDNINDYEEVKKGTDPNCPTGQNCTGASTNSEDSMFENQALNNLLEQSANQNVSSTATPNLGQGNTNAPLSAEEKEALKKILGDSKDPAVLRNFLLASGADKAYVDSLKDQDLQQVINEILK